MVIRGCKGSTFVVVSMTTASPSSIVQQDVEHDYEVCRQVTFTHAKTFYFASHFIPRKKRAACYAVYAFCRYVDDIVDVAMEQGHVTRDDACRLVEQWRTAVGQLYDGATTSSSSEVSHHVLRAWEHTLQQYHIPRHLPEELIEGVLMDTEVSRFATFDDLREYCYKVASVVGLMTSEIFQYSSAEAIPHAIDLGIAMQLTNIIRDVKEDAVRGRIYLPQDELAAYGVSEADVLASRWSENMHRLMQFQVERAHAYYDSADCGIAYLEPDSRLTVQLMSTNYRNILTVVERADFNVFQGRASTSLWQKVSTIPTAWWKVRQLPNYRK